MGCFLTCFGSSKDKKRRKQRHKVLPREQRKGSFNRVEYTVSLPHTEKPSSPVSYHQRVVIKDTSQEQLLLSCRKRVTFNSNVKTYDHDQVTEVSLVEKEEEATEKREETSEKPKKPESHSEDSSITSSSGSYPPNHRYQNCRDSDDELDYEESDIDDDDEDEEEVGDEDFGEVDYDDPCENEVKSGSRVRGYGNRPIIEEIDDPVVKSPEREVKVNPSARDRSIYVHPVLNPIENLSQWKAVKSEGIPQSRNEINSDPCFRESSFSFKASSDKSRKPNQEVAVDASLSNWLGTPESRPIHNGSSTGSAMNTPERRMPPVRSSPPSGFDDRPILGALTVEEIKQISANCSPKRSPSRSPDEMPIIGTVGTYWNESSISDREAHSLSTFKGIPNTTSKYREDKRVKWHTTPFETRLERALSGGGGVAGEA